MGLYRVRWPVVAGLLMALAAGAGFFQWNKSAEKMPAATERTDIDDSVTRALAAGKPTVIEFGANSCVSCREMKPILAALSKSHGDQITVADVDILKEREYISRYQIRLMPTQVFFNAQGQEIGRHMGKINADAILARLNMSNTP